jgi:hypothetical protein
MHPQQTLDPAFLEGVKRRVESLIVPAMEAVYRDPLDCSVEPFSVERVLPSTAFPHLKPRERIVSYFDYRASGVSVLAPLAAGGDDRSAALVRTVVDNTLYYAERIHMRHRDEAGDILWEVPLRRLLAHLALAWPHLERLLPEAELASVREMLTAQVEAAIEHNHRFWPGVRGWLFKAANNHTAIFAQGIWLCGKALERSDWVALIEDFAQRYLDDMHPDGYFDENAMSERLDGPSMVYTPLTAGSLYDILDGPGRQQEQFVKAGRFYRRFLNHDYTRIPIADERTNSIGRPTAYGLALHSLTPEGRGMLGDLLADRTYLDGLHSEGLAVLHHELGLMIPGPTDTPENRREGDVRITMPIGVVRRDGWTAALCGLRATNHEFRPNSDYALDQQSHVYLSHERLGVFLPGTKGKNNPLLSTCRRGEDAYTIATGELLSRPDHLGVTAHYRTFDVRISWGLEAGVATLRFESDLPEEIITSLPLTKSAEACLRTQAPHEIVEVPGFSPYAAGNRDEAVRTSVFHWQGRLELAFAPSA